jgi:hypothetical protein
MILGMPTPQPPHIWRHPSEGATVPDSPLDWGYLIRILARTSRRTQTSCPGLKYPKTVYRLPPPFAPGSHSRTSFRQQMQELRQTVVDRQARHKIWNHRRNRRQHKEGRTNNLDPWVSGVLKRATQGTGTSCAQETGYGQTGYAPTASLVS